MRKPVSHRGTADYARVLSWLDSRINYERSPAPGNSPSAFGLTRMRRLLHLLGDPHDRCPVVHVAGTKGKGSTVAMMAAILEDAGHRVGRYLSPHVHAIEERIAVNSRPISRSDFVSALDAVIPRVESMDQAAGRRGCRGPTWFEVITAAAFVHFAAQDVDIAVLETGLGGRLDATNVCQPLVSVITSISYDHMKLLGPTIARIASEKAGIIKRGCPIVSGATQPTARRVIAETAGRRRSRLLQLGRDFSIRVVAPPAADHPVGGVTFDVACTGDDASRRYAIQLAGHHQAENASLAVIAADVLRGRGIDISDAAIERGLSRVTLPARIETVAHRPVVVIDAAHNEASMKALADTIRPALVRHSSRVLVFAVSGDKRIDAMLRTVRGLFDHVIITRYLKNPRSAPLERLRTACAAAGLPVPKEAATPDDALRSARSLAGRGGIVVVAGSFFLAAEVGEAARR